MNIKSFLTTMFLLMVGTATSFAQETILRGAQVTKESDLVSGKPYILYYVGNQASCYVKASSGYTYFQIAPDDNTISDEAIFIFTKEETTWKIQSQKTGKYFPTPNSIDEFGFKPAETGGSWTLNFQQDGTIAPYCGDYCLDRSNGKLHSNTIDGTFPRNVNQMKIYDQNLLVDHNKLYTLNSTASKWMFAPTDDGNHYYLFNTDESKFAYPSESGNWTLSDIAVPVCVVKYSNSEVQIKTKGGSKTFSIGGTTVITLAEAGDVTATETEKLTTATSKLLGSLTKLTAVSGENGIATVDLSTVDGVETVTDNNAGWYAIRIHSDSEHPINNGDFFYTMDTEKLVDGWKYPLSHGGSDFPKHPMPDDATYYVRLWPVTIGSETFYHWQVPTGKYVVNYLNNYPIIYNRPLSDFVIGLNTDGTFYIQSSDFRAQAQEGYIGKTSHKNIDSPTKLELYKVDPSTQGLTAWRVVFNEGAEEIPLTCTRNDVKGPKTVYNRGYFFLPSNITPIPDNFDTSNSNFAGKAVIDEDAKTITVKYAPDVCFTADDVSVAQGSRTTGIGNTKQVLLRTKIVPQAPCTLKALEVTLAGAEQFDKVEAYLTSADQLHADGVSSTLLGSKNSGLTSDSNEPLGDITIDLTTNTPVLRMGEIYYVWLTADIKSTAQESEIVDAAIVSIAYTNAKSAVQTVDLTSKGDPEGHMRIFKAQSFVKVSTENNGTEAQYYRNPAILNIGENTVLAFCDYRYDNVNGLGKDYDGSNYGHCMDVIVRKSTNNGKTWGDAITIAAGTEGATPSGYAGPAVVYNGSKIICLMAKGSSSYDNGLTQIAMSTSTNGTSWTPSEILINWNGLSPTSFYVTPGKGVAYSDGHVAFVINAKVDGRLQEYLLYSNTGCTSWTVDPTPLSGKGKESKLQLKNDGSLLVMGKTPVSKDCNNDLLSFKRSGNNNTSYDVILQTVIWKNDGTPQRLKDMRLYASFDQATTWKELFYIQPGNGATSSMQKLSDNDLAICFEDGSIGNDEKDGCYALTYVVIDGTMIGEQSAETNTATIIATEVTARTAPYVNGSGWTKSVVTNKASGFPDITISANHAAFNREGSSQRYFIIKPSAHLAKDEITITAPPGYVIESYSITGDKKNASENYTLTSGENTATFNGGTTQERTLTVNNIFSPSTTFTFKSNSESNNSYSLISDFTIKLAREEYGVKLNRVNDNVAGKSYATLYTAYDLRQTDETTKAYYITEVTNGKAVLTMTGNEGRDIPKNTAVVLINSEGNTYTEFTLVSGMTPMVDESVNLLKGTLESMSLDMKNNPNYYSLGRRRIKADESSDWGDYVAGFYNTGNTITLGANRAYLVTGATASRGFDLPWGNGDTTSMADEPRVSPEEQKVETPYYTLDGRQINGRPTVKGIYIKDRKKVIIK